MLHGSAGQGGKSDHVSGGIDVRHRGLKMFIDDEFAAAVRFQACRLDIELIAVGLPSDGVEQSLAVNVFAAFEFGEDAVASFIQADRNDFFSQAENRSQLPQLEAEALDDFAVDEVQQGGPLIEQGDFYSERRKHGRIFQPDNSGADDHQIARNFFQAVNLIGIKDAFAVNGNISAVRRAGAAGDHDVLAANQLGAVFAFDFDGMGIEEARVAFQGGYISCGAVGP